MIPTSVLVVVVDDVLALENMLCMILQLLAKSGIRAENVCALVTADFPVHHGREWFGAVHIQSLDIRWCLERRARES